jgi:hypothetical protein
MTERPSWLGPFSHPSHPRRSIQIAAAAVGGHEAQRVAVEVGVALKAFGRVDGKSLPGRSRLQQVGPLGNVWLANWGCLPFCSATADMKVWTRRLEDELAWKWPVTKRGHAGVQTSHGYLADAGGECPMNLSAHWMKYFTLGASVWPPSCWRHASSPSSKLTFTAGIFSVW